MAASFVFSFLVAFLPSLGTYLTQLTEPKPPDQPEGEEVEPGIPSSFYLPLPGLSSSSSSVTSSRQPRRINPRPPEYDMDYADEAHIKAFQEALAHDDEADNSNDALLEIPASQKPRFVGGGDGVRSAVDGDLDRIEKGVEKREAAANGDMHTLRKIERAERKERMSKGAATIEKISAKSGFAPVRQRVKPAGNKRRGDVVREGWAYHVSRWPLLALIFGVMFTEFALYVGVRQLVNLMEYISLWRGHLNKLRQKLRSSKTYEEWKKTALELDAALGYEDWKRQPQNAYYDAGLIRRVIRNLKELREKDDPEGAKAVLEVCLRSNFAGVESFRLYSETHMYSKDLVEEYTAEVEKAVSFIAHSDDLSLDDKAAFFKHAGKNFGSSALCLSGGATFGYYHFGVVRALLDAKLLPRVITGTSAGSLVAAFVCTHTDEELDRLLVPELAEMITACEDPIPVWLRRFWRTGARFDTVAWARKSAFFTNGSMTFKEAYERTGRILNVSVVPYDTHSPTKLLNYLTAPDCLIFTAIIASAAVPGILNPVVLMRKTKDGSVKPLEFQGRHKDGSLRVDIPIESLHFLFNVNYSIVSQVNPHIHLFFFQPRGSPGRPVTHRKGKGWRGGFFLSAAEQLLKLELTKNFRVIRDLELLPEIGGHNFSAVFLQKFEGSVTISPKSRAWDWVRILTDPDEKELARMIDVGQKVTWPKIHMIENRMRIEREIDAGREMLRHHILQNPEVHHKHRHSPSLHGHTDTGMDSGSEGGMYSDVDMHENLGPLPSATTAPPMPFSSRTNAMAAANEAPEHIEELHLEHSQTGNAKPKTNGKDPVKTRRKVQIIADLGLAGKPGRRRVDFTIPKASIEDDLRRRHSVGAIQLGNRIRSREAFGLGGFDDSDEDAIDADGDDSGGEGAYSSGGESTVKRTQFLPYSPRTLGK